MSNERDTRFNAINERMKYKYRIHLKRIGRKDAKTVNEELKHLRYYERFTAFESFKTFSEMVAEKYINQLLADDKSLSYIDDNLRALRGFLIWLKEQRGYKSSISYNHIQYLGLTNNQRRTAKSKEYKMAYKYEQIITAIRNMPSNTVKDKRDRAMASLQALCGLRIGELRTVKIKNLVQEDGQYFIFVHPKDMSVKFAKQRQANFMPLPEDIKRNVLEWMEYLRAQGFKKTEPLFPQISARFNQHNLLDKTLTLHEIKSDTTIRDIFKRVFEAAEMEYINPHSFRHTMARFAERQKPEFLNAVRQSLGHSSIDTTLNSYGQLSNYEQTKRFSETVIAFEW